MRPVVTLLVIASLGCSSAARSSDPAPAAPTEAELREQRLPQGLRAGTHDLVRDSLRLWYRVAGDYRAGVPPVVFLHGGPGQGSSHFEALAGPFLEPTLRMVYFDQRGSGRSQGSAADDYSIPTLVEDIEALRQALGVEQIAVLGHSFGALLALEYAAKYPRQTSHVIFVSGVWDMDVQCRLRLRRLAELRPEAYARVRGDTLRPDGTRRSDCELEFRAFRGADHDAYNTEIMYPNPAIERRIDSVEAAHGTKNRRVMGPALFAGGLLQYRFTAIDRLRMPVLVVAGRHDGAAVSAGLRELALRLPKGRFVELDESGHFVYLDEPERFAREVTAFVEPDPTSGASARPAVDHVIVAIDTLERGIAQLREKTGVEPVFGGVHPGRGTQNALLSLGEGVYLELIAPNPADSAGPAMVVEYAAHRTLTPVGWAMHTSSADSLRTVAIAAGLPGGVVNAGGRTRPDGTSLSWRTVSPWGRRSGLLPFFIQWGAGSAHPSAQSPSGCTLAEVSLESPAPDSLRSLLQKVSIDAPISTGPAERMHLTLDCPAGRVRLP